MASKNKVLSLYKILIREAKKFPSYNYRNYALRRIRNEFQVNKSLTDPDLIMKQIEIGLKNLEIIKRQTLVGHLYKTEKLVIENIQPQT